MEDDSNQPDLTFTRLDYLAWRVVSKAAKRRPGREAANRSIIEPVIRRARVPQPREGERREADQPKEAEHDPVRNHEVKHQAAPEKGVASSRSDDAAKTTKPREDGPRSTAER